MSAAPRIIEGTWEEIKRHSDELIGRKLKVIVMDDDSIPFSHPAFDTSPVAVEAWIARLRAWAANSKAVGPIDDSRDSIYADRLDRQL